MICSWSTASSHSKLQLKVLHNYHILQDLSLYLHLLILCCFFKNTLFTFTVFVDELSNTLILYTFLVIASYGSVLLNSKYQGLIDIITVNMRPLDSFWRLKTMTKEMQPRVTVASLTIPLSLIVIILIKRSIEATVVLQDAKIIAETSSINGNY